MYVDGQVEAFETRNPKARHAVVDRRAKTFSEDAEPRLAAERTNPRESPITLPLRTRGDGFSETA